MPLYCWPTYWRPDDSLVGHVALHLIDSHLDHLTLVHNTHSRQITSGWTSLILVHVYSSTVEYIVHSLSFFFFVFPCGNLFHRGSSEAIQPSFGTRDIVPSFIQPIQLIHLIHKKMFEFRKILSINFLKIELTTNLMGFWVLQRPKRPLIWRNFKALLAAKSISNYMEFRGSLYGLSRLLWQLNLSPMQWNS